MGRLDLGRNNFKEKDGALLLLMKAEDIQPDFHVVP